MNSSQRMTVFQGDITQLRVDAIVNAANQTLLGGGGVDGAIHRAAGPELLEECRKLGGCPTGEARITRGYLLPADYIIHTVGPVWKGGARGEPELLARCYDSVLSLARDHALKSVAFPGISTGVYGYPVEKAAHIAVATVFRFIEVNAAPERVCFCTFSPKATHAIQEQLAGLIC